MVYAQPPSAPSSLSMKVDLFISGRNLKDLDVFSKSDPICIMSEYNTNTKQWVKMGQTEQIKNNLNPDFSTKFTINYYFEKKQQLKFQMIDWDGAGDYDTIGEVESTMGAIMGAKGQIFKSNLVHGNSKNRGTILVRAESVQESKLTACFQMKWTNISNQTAGCLGMCPEIQPVRFEISR